MSGIHAEEASLGPGPARALLKGALADPLHLPELLASFAGRRLGPRAAASLQRAYRGHPDASRAELGAVVVSRGGRAVISEGAFVGGPFLLLIPFAFCAALLAQARLVMEVAGLDGRDPRDPERAVELLVLLGVHPDEEHARTALARATSARAAGDRGRVAALADITVRMARLLGLLTPADAQGSAGRLRRVAARVGSWLLAVSVFLTGLVVPLVWLPYMAFSYRRSTHRLMRRATGYYGVEIEWRAAHSARPLVAGAAHALVSVLVPVALTTVVLLADIRIAGSHTLALVVLLLVGTVAVGAVWHLWRRRRRPVGV
ncbi:hypothetical protein [Streptomyces sp. VRA16 Mangrove soil]|uniref:hypothetical protein n=1 Tax=Streptomyces sp. VRA16 Mangrove soil TaxID=2817434 RepID=UPI001A9DB848|nr:hypothetical protein [Streptomyces sp. VRA16 Mangrove soil]MBO1332818.1 hypothetical protein [Streptomyces sp. VRA16 Mangrove soil]